MTEKENKTKHDRIRKKLHLLHLISSFISRRNVKTEIMNIWCEATTTWRAAREVLLFCMQFVFMVCYTFKKLLAIAHPREDGPIRLMNSERKREREGDTLKEREKGYIGKRLTTVREVKRWITFERRHFDDKTKETAVDRGDREKATPGTIVFKKEIKRQWEDRKQPSLHLSHGVVGVYGSVSQSGRQADSLLLLALCLSHAPTLMTLLCVCLQMANLVTSLCCVVLAAVVVAYAQRRSQLGEYAFFFFFLPDDAVSAFLSTMMYFAVLSSHLSIPERMCSFCSLLILSYW